MANSNQIQTVVKLGDTFYLENKSGQYLIAADKGRYFFPQLDDKDGERLQLLAIAKSFSTTTILRLGL